MGTRADFYIGSGKDAQWLGSIAWDGYPDGITPRLEETERTFFGSVRHKYGEWEDGKHLFDAKTEEEFKERLDRFFLYRDDVSTPDTGWPWPWEDSRTTDYAYSLIDGKVYVSCFGSNWYLPEDEDFENYNNEKIEFPNMKEKQNVVYDNRSGVIFLSVS